MACIDTTAKGVSTAREAGLAGDRSFSSMDEAHDIGGYSKTPAVILTAQAPQRVFIASIDCCGERTQFRANVLEQLRFDDAHGA